MTKFTKAHEGSAVVYNPEGGGSMSAKVVKVTPDTVTIQGVGRSAVVGKRQWHRLTVFPRDSIFLVT